MKTNLVNKAEVVAEHYCRGAMQGRLTLELPFATLGQAVNFRQALHRARKAFAYMHGDNPLSPFKAFLETEIVIRLPGTDQIPPKGFAGSVVLIIRRPTLSPELLAILEEHSKGQSASPSATPEADPFEGIKEKLMGTAQKDNPYERLFGSSPPPDLFDANGGGDEKA